MTGQVLQTSDRRIKEAVVPLDGSEQLANVRKLPMFGYHLRPEFADVAGREVGDRYEAGVMAQDVQKVLPDAVRMQEQARLLCVCALATWLNVCMHHTPDFSVILGCSGSPKY